MNELDIKDKYGTFDNIDIPYRCSKTSTLCDMVIIFTRWILPTIQIFLMSAFIDEVVKFVRIRNGINAMYFLPYLIGLVFIMAIDEILGCISTITEEKIKSALRIKYKPTLIKKYMSLDYSKIEDKDTNELYKIVSDKAETKLFEFYRSFVTMIGIAIQVLGYLLIIMNKSIVSGIVIILFIPLVLFISYYWGRNKYKVEIVNERYSMRNRHLNKILTDKDSVMERTLFGWSDRLAKQWRANNHYVSKEKRNNIKQWLIHLKGISVFMQLTIMFIAFTLLHDVITYRMTVGLYISLIQAAINISSVMSWDFSDNINKVAESKSYYQTLTQFAHLSADRDNLIAPINDVNFNTIEFINVSFSYPNTEKKILSNLSFKIEKGKKYAFVGLNGAGKKTIVKLITGIYYDFSGEILIDGKSIKEYSLGYLRGLSSVLFQDYSKYYLSLYDNASMRV